MTHTTTARPNFTWPRGNIPRAPGSCLRAPRGPRRISINLPRRRGPVCSREPVSHLGYTRNKHIRRKKSGIWRTSSRRKTLEKNLTKRGTYGQDEFRPRTDSDWSANTRWLDGSPSSQQRAEKGDYCHSGSDFQSQSSKHDTKVCKRTYDNTLLLYVDGRDKKLFFYHFHAKRIKLL